MRNTGLPQGAWVIVADGEKALFLENIGDAQDMNLSVLSKDEYENAPARDWKTHKAGRFNDGPNVQRSAVQDTDWHKLEKERFADDVADTLYKAAHAGAFDKLVIVASRVVLAELRDKMHAEVKSRVMREIPKVLTNHPLDQVERILAEDLAQPG